MKNEQRVLVVIPTYNERENLAAIVPAILATGVDADILVVDDGSPDGTGELARHLGEQDPRVRLLQRDTKQGLGPAYLAGFAYALSEGYGFIVQMDADASHRPEDLPRLTQAAVSADLVIGSRNVAGGRVENWSPLRRFISRGGSVYVRYLLGVPLQDCTSGFKCFRRVVLTTLKLDEVRSNGYAFNVELNHLAYRSGFRLIEVPIVFPDRTRGRSKMSGRIFLEAAVLVAKMRFDAASSQLFAGRPAWMMIFGRGRKGR